MVKSGQSTRLEVLTLNGGEALGSDGGSSLADSSGETVTCPSDRGRVGLADQLMTSKL